MGGPGFGHGGAHLATIAASLGMTEADLRTELQGGKSVADVASVKSVSLDTVVNAIIATQTETLKQAVTVGRLTQAQADTLLANLKVTLPGQLQTKMVAGLKGPGFGERGPGGPGMRGGASLTTIATALNMTEADLRTELQSGKSVADVASAKSVALDTVINAIVAEQTTKLNQAVTNGKLTQTQADEMLAKLKADLPTLLAQKGNLGGPGRGPGRGPGFRPGAPSPDAPQTPNNDTGNTGSTL
jgi:hypothetical protein